MRAFLALFVVLPLVPAPTDLVEVPPLAEISIAALPTDVAVRLDPPQVVATDQVPPPSAAPSFASDCDEMHWYRAQAGLPARFDSLGWRESNCRNEDGVHTSCCYGWWQLNVTLHLRDHRLVDRYHACGVYSYGDVNSDSAGDKRRQACAAKALFDVVGYSAWGRMDLLDKMRSNPDRGVPCLWCNTTAKDCQINFIEHNERCCPSCDEQGGALSHPA